jgi:group I intron endonuclease
MEITLTKEKISAIYCIENVLNHFKYIGFATNVSVRWYEHKSRLNKNKHENEYLQRSYNLHGKDSFIYYIIQELPCDIEILGLLETYWIVYYDSHIDNGHGYNMSYGGDGRLGYKHSEESKKKIGDAQKGEKNHNYGKKADLELKNKLSEIQKNMPLEIKAKRGIANQGTKRRRKATSRYTGTFRHSKSKCLWHASITKNKTVYSLGTYETEIDAALAYNKKALELYGETAKLNIISNEDLIHNETEKLKKLMSNKSFGSLGLKRIKNSNSRFVGISFQKISKKYNTRARDLNGNRISCGNYENEVEAALAYNEVMLEFYGWRVKDKLNIITPEEYASLWDHPDEENLKNIL